MGKIEWCMWANQQALASATIMFICGVISTYYPKKEYGYYAIAASVAITLLEYPRGKRQRGTTPERPYQQYLAKAITAMRFVGRNYYVRFALYVGLSIPCFFQMPTVLCGAYLDITALVYLRAGLAGEQWVDPRSTVKPKDKKEKEAVQRPKESLPMTEIPAAPNRLPPKPNKPPPMPNKPPRDVNA
ncbi:hypothetical protein CAOG_06639 [Capsaspora owczarzaki ATCC 30864]|uniref:p22-phox n=1 Tax=Capsaspora owczarzaki (strain ATCC 30864) TaxID=595528 RepID=A0A0D2UMM7_CAPO3|nr:hypothetical protein CAOG_06639 [Capsaspora owczarzaki ATCC 30864]KJE96296.1 hypothetical protein CAOG_006639 [Capsaspora owczarzaki ATCC 30864]|eukprot:XP_004344260.1 hypothetical protein CAOG_06639 [Capsaspora owczarzaki ATCC 30864]